MRKTHYTAVLYYYNNLMIESSLRLFSAPSLFGRTNRLASWNESLACIF